MEDPEITPEQQKPEYFNIISESETYSLEMSPRLTNSQIIENEVKSKFRSVDSEDPTEFSLNDLSPSANGSIDASQDSMTITALPTANKLSINKSANQQAVIHQDDEFGDDDDHEKDDEEDDVEVDSLLIPIHSIPPKLNGKLSQRSVSSATSFQTSFAGPEDGVASAATFQENEKLKSELNNLKILLSTNRRLQQLNLNIPPAQTQVPSSKNSEDSFSSSSSLEKDSIILKLRRENEELKAKLELNREIGSDYEDLKQKYHYLNERYDLQLQESLELKNDLIETRALNERLVQDLQEANDLAHYQENEMRQCTDDILDKLSQVVPERNIRHETQEVQSVPLKLNFVMETIESLKISNNEQKSQDSMRSEMIKINQNLRDKLTELKTHEDALKKLTSSQAQSLKSIKEDCSKLKNLCEKYKEEVALLKKEIEQRNDDADKEDNNNNAQVVFLETKLELLKKNYGHKLNEFTKKNEDLLSQISTLKSNSSKPKDYEDIKKMNSRLLYENKLLTSTAKSLESDQLQKESDLANKLKFSESTIESLKNDKSQLSTLVAKLRKSESKLSERAVQLMKNTELLQHEIINLIDMFINFANSQRITFTDVLEDSSIKHLQRKIAKLNHNKRNIEDPNIKNMIKAILDFFSETSKSVVEGYFDDIDKLVEQEKTAADTISAYQGKITELTEELRWHIENQSNQQQQQQQGIPIRPHSPGSQLRIETLERKWKAEREKRKLEGDSADIAIKSLHDKIEILTKRLSQYTSDLSFN